ncbi:MULTISPECIES: Hpt domain-containing protein [Arthrobacter]|uniref:Hpt domain-containing protein n=1 Tax=Arthrobacter terricola TaxID=2547396 RepID=A0A4R5KLP2_9MICC|nr:MULTISPECIES: Hpt domain-containing protein [Arthrobacter]MBT8161279.1 Hpt domain-containing protein [Arthrobacter sp. GN70]TDF96122.1 Hpt domain-containing protein [Arthrobacter terricola]
MRTTRSTDHTKTFGSVLAPAIRPLRAAMRAYALSWRTAAALSGLFLGSFRVGRLARYRRRIASRHALPPALDHGAIQRLAHELHDSEAARRFATSYARMLPARVERIVRALEHGDGHQAMDAVLSLKISSAMVGALRMEQHCARLEAALDKTDHAGAAAAGEEVRRHLAELVSALGSTAD